MTAAIAIAADDQLRDDVQRAVGADTARIAGAATLDETIAGADEARAIVAVVDGGPAGLADALATHRRITAACTRSAGADVIAELVAHIADGGSVAARLPDGVEVFTTRVASYDDKLRCLQEIERFAASEKLRGKYREAISLAVDELLMNALYVAPREAAADQAAMTPAQIAARARRGVAVSWGRFGARLFVSAVDGYGSLDPQALVRAWRTAAADDTSMPAGLGMHMIAGSSSEVWVRYAPGVATEFTCTFDIGAPRLTLSRIVVVEETDDDAVRAMETNLAEATVPAPEVAPATPPWLPIALAVAIAAVIAAIVWLL